MTLGADTVDHPFTLHCLELPLDDERTEADVELNLTGLSFASMDVDSFTPPPTVVACAHQQ